MLIVSKKLGHGKKQHITVRVSKIELLKNIFFRMIWRNYVPNLVRMGQ